jgi:hypothetical protein
MEVNTTTTMAGEATKAVANNSINTVDTRQESVSSINSINSTASVVEALCPRQEHVGVFIPQKDLEEYWAVMQTNIPQLFAHGPPMQYARGTRLCTFVDGDESKPMLVEIVGSKFQEDIFTPLFAFYVVKCPESGSLACLHLTEAHDSWKVGWNCIPLTTRSLVQMDFHFILHGVLYSNTEFMEVAKRKWIPFEILGLVPIKILQNEVIQQQIVENTAAASRPSGDTCHYASRSR